MSTLGPGDPAALGATRTSHGIRFAVYARHATRMELLLFGASDASPRVIALDPDMHRAHGVWHATVPNDDLGDARYYAYRADGPNEGAHRYDSEKVLIDPYARRIHFPDNHRRDLARGFGSTLGIAPLGVLPSKEATDFDWGDDRRPSHPAHRRVIYELHVRGFTQRDYALPEDRRGTFAGVIEKIPHLKELGVTTVELLPIQQFDPDEPNYWGYMTLGFFAVHAGYAHEDADRELKEMVRALHAEGIEVVLDVVYNHTTEEDEAGPTYSFRGLDNATYYLQTDDGRGYRDDAGTGNVLKTAHPQVARLILDSLRYWATEFHIDGFRYDLASIFSRDIAGQPNPFATLAPAISHDPILAPLHHIAEPWDLGAYQVGTSFPEPSWAQWNDHFRDDIRRFVKSDPGHVEALVYRLCGSPDLFPPDLPHARAAAQSINFVVAHDGFCLNDLVSYNGKHNAANGQDNRDGSDNNNSWNCGFEGEDGAPVEVMHLRRRQRKNLIALLMLSNGVPMMYMGDEFANTQQGNNNPYNQDNDVTWLDWTRRHHFDDLVRFTRKMVAFRHHYGFGRPRAWTSEDVQWHGIDAQPDLSFASRSLAYRLRCEAGDVYAMINAYWGPLSFRLQHPGPWRKTIDTMNPSPSDIIDPKDAPLVENEVRVGPRSIVVLVSPR
ncbi:MAG: isoamylase [Myxococcota bacterium]